MNKNSGKVQLNLQTCNYGISRYLGVQRNISTSKKEEALRSPMQIRALKTEATYIAIHRRKKRARRFKGKKIIHTASTRA